MLQFLISLVLSGLFWWSSGNQYLLPNSVPLLFLIWSPLATIALILYLSHLRGQSLFNKNLFISLICLTLIPLIVLLNQTDQGLILAVIHLPLLCWFLFWRLETLDLPAKTSRSVFLRLSLNYFSTAAILAAVGGVVVGLTMGLFNASGIIIPEMVARLIFTGGFGFVPLYAYLLAFHPQNHLGNLLQTIFRLILPLLIIILTIYLIIIPFKFFVPFYDREVLAIYNVLIVIVFAVITGALPVDTKHFQHDLWIKRGLAALTLLTTLILTYATSAIIFRLINYGLTPNRLTITGWNLLNLVILVRVLIRLAKNHHAWVDIFYREASGTLYPYLVWTLIVILSSPLIPLYT